jgi:hypothetical protein
VDCSANRRRRRRRKEKEKKKKKEEEDVGLCRHVTQMGNASMQVLHFLIQRIKALPR